MTDRTFRYERHYELWQERSKQVGRWVLGTLVFAILVQWKVLRPYVVESRQQEKLGKVVASAKQAMTRFNADLAALVTVSTTLKSVNDNLKKQPLIAEKEKLSANIGEIASAYRKLSQVQQPKEVQDLLKPQNLPGVPPEVRQLQIDRPTIVANPTVQAANILQIDAEWFGVVRTRDEYGTRLLEQANKRVQQSADAITLGDRSSIILLADPEMRHNMRSIEEALGGVFALVDVTFVHLGLFGHGIREDGRGLPRLPSSGIKETTINIRRRYGH
jgi:hypothetical protein